MSGAVAPRLQLTWGSCRRCGIPTRYIHVAPFWLCRGCTYDLLVRQRADGMCPVWTEGGPGLADGELAALVYAAGGWPASATAEPLGLRFKGAESARCRATRRARALPEPVRDALYWHVRAEALAHASPRIGYVPGFRPTRWRQVLLGALAAGYLVREAAGAAGVSVEFVDGVRRRDPEFAAAYRAAMAAGGGQGRRRTCTG